MTTFESPYTLILVAPNFFNRCKPKIRDSYSVMLLEHWKFNLQEMFSMWLFLVLVIQTPAPALLLVHDPSKYILYRGIFSVSSCLLSSSTNALKGCCEISALSCVCFTSSGFSWSWAWGAVCCLPSWLCSLSFVVSTHCSEVYLSFSSIYRTAIISSLGASNWLSESLCFGSDSFVDSLL